MSKRSKTLPPLSVLNLRAKKIKQFSLAGGKEKFKAKDASENDLSVSAHSCNLRLAISDPDGKNNEPWHLVANDFESLREIIVGVDNRPKVAINSLSVESKPTNEGISLAEDANIIYYFCILAPADSGRF